MPSGPPRLPPNADMRLYQSINLLRSKHPDWVADVTLTPTQRGWILAVVGLVVASSILSPTITVMVLVAGTMLLYAASLIVRLKLFRLGLNGQGLIRVDDDFAKSYPAKLLPTFSVLVPAFHEPEVFGSLVEHLRQLDYPSDKVEFLLLLEADDNETVAAADAIRDAEGFHIVLVPAAEPRTKPKALNYGLMQATGDIVTIYDAEDRPDSLQLRKAAIALAHAPDDVACVQARLGFFNPEQNLLTRWFTLDYRMWFGELLPGLVQLHAPIPLGGTSNHFRRSALLDVGAWDAFNVTEDAELGLRFYRLGYRTGVIDSVTLEEANSDFVNWVKQRSRWYKGYAQTLLVHLRNPGALRNDVGLRGFLWTSLLVGGTPLLATLNPFFWVSVVVWFVFHPHFFREVLPTASYFLGMVSWIAGNGMVFYMWLLNGRRSEGRLTVAAALAPVYWVMMAMAAVKAAAQLITAPSYWEKTQHGLDTPATAVQPIPAMQSSPAT